MASALGAPYHDTDDYLWIPTDPSYHQRRPLNERLRLRTDTLPPDAEDFLERASHYDDGERDGRNIVRHLAWLDTLSCPVLGLDGTRPVEDLTAEVLAAL